MAALAQPDCSPSDSVASDCTPGCSADGAPVEQAGGLAGTPVADESGV